MGSALLLTVSLLVASQNEAAGASTIKVVSSKKKAAPQAEAPPPKPAIKTEAPKNEAPVLVEPTRLPSLAAPALRPAPPPEPKPAVVPAVVTQEKERTKILPWVTLGGSVVAGAFGVSYAVKTGKAIDGLQEFDTVVRGNKVVVPETYRDQQTAIVRDGLVATVLLSAAVSGVVTSLILLAD